MPHAPAILSVEVSENTLLFLCKGKENYYCIYMIRVHTWLKWGVYVHMVAQMTNRCV